ncbi:MAG TPA: hypothetical protein VFC28_00595 [Opitutaceae bacterium]|nr:hypothetical protein [Opitutaceae bacterium]
MLLPPACCQEQHVRLDGIGVEDAGRQAQDRVEISIFEQLLANGFTRAAFEEDIVGQHHRSAVSRPQHGADVLEEVELLVGGRGPEILPVVDEVVLLLLTFLVGEGHAALLAEGRIGEHVVETFAVVGDERVVGRDRALAVDLADIV